MNERFVLSDFDHPCIAKLVATFKTATSLFMLLEPCMCSILDRVHSRHVDPY